MPPTFFKPSEFACRCGRAECDAPTDCHRLLRYYLERTREMYGQPLTVTSGNRCAAWNLHEGGEKGSEHVAPDGCLGADVQCETSSERFRLLEALRHAGVTRIGIYPKHVHVGVGDMVDAGGFAGMVTWLGSYKVGA